MRAAAMTALALLLAGCAGGSGDADSQVTAPSGLPSGYTVPPVPAPLEPGRFAADPCALLTVEERTGFGLPDTERKELAGTVECLLHPSGDSLTTVQLQVMTDRGLADLVARCHAADAPAACATWAPDTVDGYPAVLDSGGQCRIMVGVAERAVLLVNDVAEPGCGRAGELAATALATLREES